jgi:hypothetical protein
MEVTGHLYTQPGTNWTGVWEDPIFGPPLRREEKYYLSFSGFEP